MKVLFATTNPAKVKKYREELEKRGIELMTLQELGINFAVEENGKNCIENATIKAKAYYEISKMPTIGMDNSLFIEELPEEKQPGTHVRRVNGKTLNDEEMISYYTNLVKEYGGELTAKWVYGMVIYNGKETKSYTWNKGNFYFIDQASQKRNPGYPLDSISIMPQYDNKYLVEVAKEDRKNEKDNQTEENVIHFIVKSLKEMN